MEKTEGTTKYKKISTAKKAKIIDDIRSGLLTLNQIAEKHKVTYSRVYRMAQMLGVKGDLHAEVIAKAQDEIVALRISDNINDSVVVGQNAQIVLTLMRDHGDQVSRARNMATTLMDDLESTIRNRNELEAAIAEKCADDKTAERENRLMRAISLPTNTKTLADLAGALKTLIGLEREIFGIGKNDGDGKGQQSLEDYVMSLPQVN